jgi:hypothetical protein
MSDIEKLGAAISDALDKCPVADVLSVLTGSLVGLTVELVRRKGEDVNKQITLDGGEQRDITIHPPKANAPKPTKAGAA